ncbi:GAF domain-containing protein [Dokdonella sp. MW10]|uniref:GAF domain-containing protein n=1 Tax=Dokdonella sp. MW10 TaxID=2992926 RepID=UPI003F7E7933
MADATPALDETERQRVLDRYRLVDSLPEGVYDDVVRVAAAICDTPIALVSLIDRDRQWFKARLGLDATETPRDVAVCDQAIRDPRELMEIPDLAGDPRFADFPAVTGELGARFYAGMPLVTPQGAAIGTVCVVDVSPRELHEGQREALQALARITMNLFENRHREHEAQRLHALEAGVAAAQSAATVEVSSATPPAVPASPAAPSAPAPAAGGGYRIAVFELQDHADRVKALGERGVERALQQLEHALDGALRHDLGDSINRVTGSTELVAVLHGTPAAETLAALRAVVDAQCRASDVCVLVGDAEATSASESTSRVFLRADDSLSDAKTAWRASKAA